MRYSWIFCALILVCVALSCKSKEEEKEKIPEEYLFALSQGAASYYHTEHPVPGTDGLEVFTEQYPIATSAVCIKDGEAESPEAEEIFEALRFSPSQTKYRLCVQSNESGQRFAMWAELGDKVICWRCSVGGQCDATEESDSCKP